MLPAISVMDHKDAYKAAVALSTTQEELSHQLGWNYDLTEINTPILLLSGTSEDFETQMVIPIEQMNSMFNKISSAEKVMARRTGEEYGEMLYSADGYVTAWFMYYLQGDMSAAAMIDEITSNELYQDLKVIDNCPKNIRK